MGPGGAGGARALSRRAYVAGLLAAGSAVATGCDPASLDPRGEANAPAGPPGSPTATPVEDPDVVADRAVVAEALAESRRATAVLERVGERLPGLAGTLAPALAVHAAHTRILQDAAPDDEAPGTVGRTRVPRRRAAALTLVRRTERRAGRVYLDLAVEARSGPLARVLASMSAGVAQQLATLPPGPPRGSS